MTEQVDVWRADLDGLAVGRHGLDRDLSTEEMERARRFRFDRDRSRYLARRAVLRVILGRYLDRASGELRFSTNRYGKPELAGRDDGRLHFNLSHSHGVGLIAVRHDGPVGVDLERIVADRADPDVARRFFAPAEVAALAGLADQARVVGFFNCWTRKEAYIKARGEGLSLPLDAFEVSVVPDAPPRLVHVAAQLGSARGWSVLSIDAGDGYVAALAVPAERVRVRQVDFTWAAPDAAPQ